MLKTDAKIIPGYKGVYDITSDGRVYSHNYGRKTELKLSEHKGYRRVALSVDNKRKIYHVHVLVAKAFIPNPLNKPFINHIDGNKKNNNVSNLEWCTHAENQKHSREVLGNTNRGERNGNHGYMKSKFYPSQELRNRLIELGIPRNKHDIVSLGEMLPHGTSTGKTEQGLPWCCYEVYPNTKGIGETTEADARAKMLIYLIENNLLTTK